MFTQRTTIGSLLLCMVALFFMLGGIHAQQAAPAQPAAVSAPDFEFTPVVANGTVIGNRHFDKSARYTGSAGLAENGTAVFMVEWPDLHKGSVKGLYTSAPDVVVEEGDVLDGSAIVQLTNSRASDVQIGPSGEVAFRAVFSGKGCASGTCGGLFLNKKLQAIEVNGTGTYYLTPDGKIAAPLGVWAAPTANVTGSASSGADSKTPGGILNHIWGTVQGPVINIHGIRIGGGASTTPTQQTGQQGQKSRQVQVSAPTVFKPEPMPVQANCQPLGSFPLPWSDIANGAGPIALSRTDGPFGGERYVPAGRPRATNWRRTTYYSADCRPIAIALSDGSGRGTLEIHTTVGLVAYLDQARGVYKLNGAEDVAPPASGNPLDADLRLNRRCEILLPVTYAKLGAGKALLKGIPLKRSNCPE